MRLFAKRQDNTTNSDKPNSLIQMGSSGMSNTLTKAITFPIAYKNVPQVYCCGIGGDASTSTFAFPAANATAFADRVFAAGNQATTGFTAVMSGTASSSSQIAEFCWIAIGDM